jgi:hypothetical protein
VAKNEGIYAMETKKTNQIVEIVLSLLVMPFTDTGCERELNKSAELKESAEQSQSLKEVSTISAEAEELGIIIERMCLCRCEMVLFSARMCISRIAVGLIRCWSCVQHMERS